MQCSEEADEEEEEDEEEEDGEEEVENSSCVEEEVMLRSDEQDLRTGSDDEQPEAECESTPRGASGDDHIAASGIENLSLTDGTEVDSDSASKDKEAACSCVQSHTSETGDNPKSARTDECQAEKFSSVMNSVEMVDTDGLISLLKSLHKGEKHTPGITTVGLVCFTLRNYTFSLFDGIFNYYIHVFVHLPGGVPKCWQKLHNQCHFADQESCSVSNTWQNKAFSGHFILKILLSSLF